MPLPLAGGLSCYSEVTPCLPARLARVGTLMDHRSPVPGAPVPLPTGQALPFNLLGPSLPTASVPSPGFVCICVNSCGRFQDMLGASWASLRPRRVGTRGAASPHSPWGPDPRSSPARPPWQLRHTPRCQAPGLILFWG